MTDQKTQGCVVCNPELVRTVEEVTAERREKFTEILHIVQINGGYHIVQIPGPDDETLYHWAGAFDSEDAAELFLPDMISACAEGSPSDALCSGDVYDFFNLAGRILRIIRKHDGGEMSLAQTITKSLPWECRRAAATSDTDCHIPF